MFTLCKKKAYRRGKAGQEKFFETEEKNDDATLREDGRNIFMIGKREGCLG
jgi:hypothetical protein